MFKALEGFDSTFRYILIAAKRASQLIDGARPRVETRHTKPTTIALDELAAKVVPWRVVTPEEFEALRLAEVQAREKEEQPPVFLQTPRPVVPLIEEADVDEEEEELEDELADPDFEAEELGEVEDMPEELLGEEVVPEGQ
jgi:DNA-directed RNA polymerase subunit omega